MKIITKNYILKKMTIKMINNNYLNWFKDNKTKKYIHSSPKTLDDLKQYLRSVNKDPKTFFWAIFKNKKHVGNIKIDKIDFKEKKGTLGILIGNKNFRNVGLAGEVIDAIKKFLLKKNIQYLYLGVEKTNISAIKLYKKCDFFTYKTNKNFIYMKCNLFTSRLVLGGAQLNSNYGITNFKNKDQSKTETKKIINILKQKNIFHIDGAESYKIFRNSKFDYLKNFKIDTKVLLKDISNYKNLKLNIKKYLDKNIKVETLFIHDGDNIFNKFESKKLDILHKLKKEKIIKNIGISIYDFKILKKIILKLDIDVIQIPYNIVDRRLEKFHKLILKNSVKIYIRSIFLQGSLLKKVDNIKELSNIYQKVSKFTKKTKQSNFDACLNFVLNNDLVDKIIVGVRNSLEIKKLINFKPEFSLSSVKFNKDEKLFAYNPSKWK
jgi:aryl-alcohol dehydrogenase-like predicted oxidoreductase/RimJ/RimL family protein N-acetyltransferase